MCKRLNSHGVTCTRMLVAAGFVLLGLQTLALAQTPAPVTPPSAADIKQAKEYVDAAVIAQKNGDYKTAIEMNTKANAIAPHPELIYNLAQAHRQLNEKTKQPTDRDAARGFYRRYLELSPTGANVGFAQEWLTKLDAQYQTERPAEEAAERAAVLKQIEDERLAKEAAERDKAKKAAEVDAKIDTAVVTTNQKNTKNKARTLKIVGLGVGGLGIAAVATGAYFGVSASGIESDLEKSKVFDTEEISRGNRHERYMYIAYASGAALLIGGAVTYYLGMTAEKQQRKVLITPNDGGASVLLRGRW
jgi:tetratricopeptide (TPR) repeat protein